MSDMKLEEGIRDIVRRDPRFAPQAYYFIFEALEYTLHNLNIRRHVSGRELLDGTKQYALEVFGFLARTVFYEWGITSTEDIGQLVFNLVSADLLMKNEADSMADFRDAFDFEEAFDEGFRREGLPLRIDLD
ncbi:MAG: Minf_1886 family protein [Planctomycetota bacterium]